MIKDCTAVACIPTKDLATARRFYEDKLELDVLYDNEGGVGYACGGGSSIFLYESEHTGAKHTLCNFMSDHVDDDIAELRERGVSFDTYPELEGVEWEGDVATMGDTKGVWFHDPEGNTFALFQMVDVPAMA